MAGGITALWMAKEIKKVSFDGTPFSIECTPRQTGPKTWGIVDVEIFRDGQPIGKYTRGYPAYSEKTFYPFEHNGVWYALYSENYSKLQVARLQNDQGQPAFEPWCDDSGGTHPGFCPTEVYIPQVKEHLRSYRMGGEEVEYWHATWDNQPEYNEPEEEGEPPPKETRLRFASFGFLCGCYWGDDSLWKIRFIDLSEVHNKVMKITERWGYCPLPVKPLRECVILDEDDTNGEWIGVLKVVYNDK